MVDSEPIFKFKLELSWSVNQQLNWVVGMERRNSLLVVVHLLLCLASCKKLLGE